jgi:hypothetical protein
MIPKSVQICGLLLRGDFDMVNIRIRKNLFLTYLFIFILAFQRHIFCCNIILEPKVMIKLLRRTHSGFFPQITIFLPTSLSLNSKLIWSLNLSKSEFSNFVIILEFDGFSSKTCKIQENTKHQIITKLRA